VQSAYTVPIPFSDTKYFNVNDNIEDLYTYTHTLTGLNSADYDLIDATLFLRHNGNSNNDNGEVWFTASNTDIKIGELSASGGATWTLDSWLLSANILTEIESSTPWSLTIRMFDNTPGKDKIKLDYSTLAGNYESSIIDPAIIDPPTNEIPEPSTILLLGTGIAGVGLLRKRFKI
jgi:hypothetical protein